MRRTMLLLALSILLLTLACNTKHPHALVFQSDFGVKDAAVASMKGVAFGVSSALQIHDLTHEIPAFNIWEAAQRLHQTAEYWPSGTVFVSVVDPGVGTARKSVVLKTESGHFFVTPDNGTLTLVAEHLGVASVREIDEAVNRRKDSQKSYTFHGRDVYAFTGARVASGTITFEGVGRELAAEVVSIPYQRAQFTDGRLQGNIPILDVQYGNIWTNIDRKTFENLGLKSGEAVWVKIIHQHNTIFEKRIPFQNTFGEVALSEPLLYLNSLSNLSLALREDNFAKTHSIQSGPDWNIEIRK